MIWHLAKRRHLAKREMTPHLEMPRGKPEDIDVRTGGNGYKNVLDFIITLVVVNFNKFFSYTD